MNKVEAVIVKVNPPNYLIRIKRGKFKHWHYLGQHKETDLAFRLALKELHASFVPGGFCGHFDNDLQKWDFESDERNGLETIRKHKDGGWYSASGMYFTINAEPHEKYDYNF